MLVSFVANSPLLQYLIDALLRPLGGTPEGVVEGALSQGRGQGLHRAACLVASARPPLPAAAPPGNPGKCAAAPRASPRRRPGLALRPHTFGAGRLGRSLDAAPLGGGGVG